MLNPLKIAHKLIQDEVHDGQQAFARKSIVLPEPAPNLTTKRFILRQPILPDFAALHKLCLDPLVRRYMPNIPPDEETLWMRFLRNVGHWTLHGYGQWTMVSREDKSFVGVCGFATHRRNMTPQLLCPELTCILSPHIHAKGCGREVLSTVLDWADQLPAFQHTMLVTLAKNIPAQRLAEKFGYTFSTKRYQIKRAFYIYERLAHISKKGLVIAWPQNPAGAGGGT